MSDQKTIGELNPSAGVNDTDLVEIEQGGVSKSATAAQVRSRLSGQQGMVMNQNFVDVTFLETQADTNWIVYTCNVVNFVDSDPLILTPGTTLSKTTSGFRLYLNGAPDSHNYVLQWGIIGLNFTGGDATTYGLIGPASGVLDAPSTNFTVFLPSGRTVPSPVTITPHDGGGGTVGTFTPSTVILSNSTTINTFTFTPATAGSRIVSVTNSSSLTDPASITYTATLDVHLLNNLVSYWTLDETSGTRMDSVGTNNLSDTGTVTSASGIINNGAVFNGSAQTLSVAMNSSLQFSSDFTFSCWVNFSAQAGPMSLMTDSRGGAGGNYILYYDPTPGAGFTFGLAAFAFYTQSGVTVADGVWTHVVGWYDHTDSKARIRINDVATVVSSGSGGLISGTDPFTLGRLATPGVGFSLTGTLDEVGIWNRKLTSTEITALYNSGSGDPYSAFTT